MSQLFASGGQRIGVSASASVLPVNIQDWFPLGQTGWISLQSKGLKRIFSNTTVQEHQFFGSQQLYSPAFTFVHDTGKTMASTRQTFVGKGMSLLFNMLSRLVITFLPRSKCLLKNFMAAVTICSDFGPQKVKSVTVSGIYLEYFSLQKHLLLFPSDQISCSVVSDSLRPHELQHARSPCPSPTPGVHSDSHPLSW